MCCLGRTEQRIGVSSPACIAHDTGFVQDLIWCSVVVSNPLKHDEVLCARRVPVVGVIERENYSCYSAVTIGAVHFSLLFLLFSILWSNVRQQFGHITVSSRKLFQ